MWTESHLLITEQYSPFSGARSSSWHGTRPIFQPCWGSHQASRHRSPSSIKVCSCTLLSPSFVFMIQTASMEDFPRVFNHCQAPHCHLYVFGASQEQELYIPNPFLQFCLFFFFTEAREGLQKCQGADQHRFSARQVSIG